MANAGLAGLGQALGSIGPAILEGTAIARGRAAEDRRASYVEEDRQQRRVEAAQRQQMGEFQLAEMGRQDKMAQATAPAREEMMLAELKTQTATLKQQNSKIFQQESFQVMQNFWDGGGSERSTDTLNQFIQKNKDNPLMETMFLYGNDGRPVRVDPVSDAGAALGVEHLRNMPGVDEEMLKEMDLVDGTLDDKYDMEAIKRRFVNVTYQTGNQHVIDMVTLSDISGFTRWTSAKQKEEMLAMRKLAPKTPTATAMERNANRYAASKGISEDDAFNLGYEASLGGTQAGKLGISQSAKDQWNAGGFSQLSHEDLQKSPEARKLVERIEMSQGLSSAEKAEMRELSSIISLSQNAADLTSDQTGIWDNMTNKAASYVTDDITNAKAKASYSALMNQVRNNLFGATLTDGEITAFKDAYGSLGQKHGKVLAGLSTALTQVQAKLKTIMAFSDPAVIQFRTGKTVEELDEVMATLDLKIAMYDSVAVGEITVDQAAELLQNAQASGASGTEQAPPAQPTLTDEMVQQMLFGGN